MVVHLGGNLLAAFFTLFYNFIGVKTMLDLTNKVALITGATGALGRTTTQIFAAANSQLVLTGRDDSKLAELSGQLTNTDHTVKTCDLSSEQETEQLVQHAIDQYGRIDILINVAGGFAMGKPVHELSHDDFNAMLQMNFISTLNTCKKVIPHMLNQGTGKIVNVSARAATAGKAKMAPYCISKSAVVTLTESLAAEYENINVNCVLPGTINTPTNKNDMPNADHSTWVPPEDVAKALLFLSSASADSISGAVLPVYGKS